MKLLKAMLLLAALISMWVAQPASAEVKWWTRAEWGPSTLEPGGKGEIVLYTRSYGSSPSTEPFAKIVDQLPAGVLATAVNAYAGFAPTSTEGRTGAACGGVGTGTITCTMTTAPVPALDDGLAEELGGVVPAGPMIIVDFRVSPSAAGTGTNTVTVSGGGDPTPAVVENQVPFGKASEEFGVNPSTYANDVFDEPFPADGAPYRQAAGHPGDFRLNFDLNERFGENVGAPHNAFLSPAGGRLRNVVVTLPRGLIGNPEAVPKCKPLEFLNVGQDTQQETGCPPDTQVGTIDVQLGAGADGNGGVSEGDLGIAFSRAAVYNLEPPKGVPADFGFQFGGFAIGHVYASLDPSKGYAIRTETPYNSEIFPIRSVRFTQWGVPGDPAHDVFRGHSPVLNPDGTVNQGTPPFGAPFTAPIKPFFTNPSDCGVDNGGFQISVDSWKDPGQFTTPLETENHLDVSGCEDERMRFHPDVSLQPTSRAAGGPTGLKVDLEVPQRDQTVENAEELYAQNGSIHGIDTPPMKKAVITFPAGMTLSTSAAQGLSGCTEAEIGLGTNDPVTCPDSSQYGELTIHTPLLPPDEPMHGYIYIAKQGENPFHTFLAMYFVIEDPSRGLRVKLPGRFDLDPKTGQITTTFDDLPPFPVSDLQLSIKGGVRAGLVNPPTCGEKQITATFFSWAAPTTPITKTSSYDVTQKPDGTPCVNNLGERPFAPQLQAGTVSNSAESFTPFAFRLTRTDEDQEFSQLATTLPPGLIAKLAGISECPDAAISQAIARTAAGQGTLEQLSPSCPPSSQIGTTEVGTGVGQALAYIPGKAYLAGPYRGAPLSMVVITPILTGPYDLGVIAVRAAIQVDPETTQVSIKTDPFPQIYQGIPVRIRDIRVNVDRPEMIETPSSCDPMQITAHVTGVGGDLESTADDSSVDLSQRFQAADCGSLPFKPRLSLRLNGGTKRSAHPALEAVIVDGASNEANVAHASVTLPHSEFLAESHIRTVCTRVQFSAGAGGGSQCPAGSIYGHAKAWTPLLDKPLEGPVFLRSNGGERLLPDLVASLGGQIHVDLVGFVDHSHGGIRTRFENVPDAFVSRFVLSMASGKKGLLENSEDLCDRPHRAISLLDAHNSKTYDTHPLLEVRCKVHRRKKR